MSSLPIDTDYEEKGAEKKHHSLDSKQGDAWL